MPTLETVLNDNGLGEWHTILDAERVTIDNIAHLTLDGTYAIEKINVCSSFDLCLAELKDIGLPLGARKDIVLLFGAKPQRPDGPAPAGVA